FISWTGGTRYSILNKGVTSVSTKSNPATEPRAFNCFVLSSSLLVITQPSQTPRRTEKMPQRRGRGIKAQWMDDSRLYGRRCDVKKPQLTIGYSAALTGEEKARQREARPDSQGRGLGNPPASCAEICFSLFRRGLRSETRRLRLGFLTEHRAQTNSTTYVPSFFGPKIMMRFL